MLCLSECIMNRIEIKLEILKIYSIKLSFLDKNNVIKTLKNYLKLNFNI